MPRPTKQDGNWNYTVVPTRLHLPNGKPTSIWATVRTDTEQTLGAISEKGYGILQNFDFISTIQEALKGLGLTDYKEHVVVSNEGRRIYAVYNFDNRIKTLHKVGDQVGLVLRFQNSFDGKLAAKGELMARILRCLNGAVMEEGEFALQQKHTPKLNTQFVQDVIARAVNDFDRGLQVFNALAGVPVSDEQGINILKRLSISDTAIEAIQGIWVNPSFIQSRLRNLYTLYDAATEHLRDMEGTRYERAIKMNRVILKTIVSAMDPANFAKLVLPVETEVVAVEKLPILPAPGPTIDV